MKFRKFEEFLKTREISERATVNGVDVDRRRLTFNNTYANEDPKVVEKAILATGKWPTVQAFINDPDESKYSKVKMPGAENWVR